MAFLNQISQVLIKFSLQSLRSLAATRRPRAGHAAQELGQVVQVLGAPLSRERGGLGAGLCLAEVRSGETPQGHSC